MDNERGIVRIYVIVLLVSAFSFFGMTIIFFIANTLISFRLIGDENVFVPIGSEYVDYGYVATFNNKRYDKVVVIDNVDTSKLGKYEVNYSLTFLCFTRELTRVVNVVDNVLPELSLYGNDYVYLEIGSPYIEAGFDAVDNLDGDITDKVVVNNNIDIETPGVYEVVYSVKDSSDNYVKTTRKVEVISVNPLTMSIKDFNLDYYFKRVTLVPDEQEYDYLKDAILVGDSNTTYLYRHGKYMPANQIWGKNGLNVAQINSSTFTMFDTNRTVTFEEAMASVSPKYLILNVGITSVEFMTADKFKEELLKFINNMRTNHSDVKLVITALLPVHQGSYNYTTQKKINEFNYYIGEICEEYSIPFVNFAQTVKGTDGLANKSLFECYETINCGFHLNESGKKKYVDYLKHLNFEKEM
ncbi:MAG: DUF5011 domain-containing protein [Bacilli bacterium]|nr:DUF5011 domain-containing protein [Bacilli bacterium]